MRVLIVTPAPPASNTGNRVTALRWARLLRELGHRVRIEQVYAGSPCDVMVALHARRSFPSVRRFRRDRPDLPMIVALTGTDVYRDLPESLSARKCIDWATRLVVLQPKALDEIPSRFRTKARVIYQSVRLPASVRRVRPKKDTFEVCVLGHLRPVKDPFRAAAAARMLPVDSRMRVLQVGAALSGRMERRAIRESEVNPRYSWLGRRSHVEALRLMARCRLLVLSSRLEGGANVVSEAIAASVPVLSSRISGSIGILGEDYPGYFPFGDTAALASLLERAERDTRFYESLRRRCARLAPVVEPVRERRSWKALLAEL